MGMQKVGHDLVTEQQHGGSDDKESTCNAGDPDSIPGLEEFSWRRGWLPTPVFLPGKLHGERNLVGYSPWGCKESDTIE